MLILTRLILSQVITYPNLTAYTSILNIYPLWVNRVHLVVDVAGEERGTEHQVSMGIEEHGVATLSGLSAGQEVNSLVV